MAIAHRDRDGLRERLQGELAGWAPRSEAQRTLKADYERFLLDAGAAAIDRDLGRAHVTGSAFVFTPDLSRVLLCLHRKAGVWLQLGGHVEPADVSVQATAEREAREEGGISRLVAIGAQPLDLDRHGLGPGFTRCDTHWDIGYGFIASGTPIASAESDAVAWWPVDDLPVDVPADLPTRVGRAVRQVGHPDAGTSRQRARPAP